jgi:hypothetical protein
MPGSGNAVMRRLYVQAWLLGNSPFDLGVPPRPRLVIAMWGLGAAWLGGEVAAILFETALLPFA